MAGTCICRFDLKGRGGPRRIATMGCPLHDPRGCDDGGEPETVREIEHFPVDAEPLIIHRRASDDGLAFDHFADCPKCKQQSRLQVAREISDSMFGLIPPRAPIREIEHFPFTDHRSVAEVDAGVPAGAKPFRITAIPRPLSGQVFVAFDAMKASYTAMIPIAVAREIAEALDGALAILDGQHPAQTGVAVEGLGR
jgi:hypothetical protein